MSLPCEAVEHRRRERFRKFERDVFERPVKHAEQRLRVVAHLKAQRRWDGALLREGDVLHAVHAEIDDRAAPVVPRDEVIVFVFPTKTVRARYVRLATVFIDLLFFALYEK